MLEPKGDNTLFETGLEILKDREFTKKKQRGSIVTGRRAGIFSMPNVPSALGTASLEINNKLMKIILNAVKYVKIINLYEIQNRRINIYLCQL